MRKSSLFAGWFSSAVIIVAVVLFAGGSDAQTSDPSLLSLARIEFSGLKTVSQEQSIAATGLHIGQRITKTDLEKALKDLHDAGLFSKAQFKYRQYEDRYEVTFLVEEYATDIPVVFDNFVWFTDKELTDAVKKRSPISMATHLQRKLRRVDQKRVKTTTA